MAKTINKRGRSLLLVFNIIFIIATVFLFMAGCSTQTEKPVVPSHRDIKSSKKQIDDNKKLSSFTKPTVVKMTNEMHIGQVMDLVEADDGNILIISNTTQKEKSGKCYPSCDDMLLTKIDPSGKEILSVTFGGEHEDLGEKIRKTSDGGFIIVGSTESYGLKTKCIQDFPCSNLWLLKIDSNGQLQWQKAYGGRYDDEGYDVMQTKDGGYLAVGKTGFMRGVAHCEDDSIPCHYSDGWVLRLDKNGNFLWDRTTGGKIHDNIFSVSAAPDGGFVVTGLIDDLEASGHAFIQKFSASGKKQWLQSIILSEINESFDIAYAVFQTSDGGFLVAGLSWGIPKVHHGIWIRKYKSGGKFLWQKIHSIKDTNIRSPQIKQTTDGGLIIGGFTDPSRMGGSNDENYYLLKTTADGAKQWEKIWGGQDNNNINGIAQSKTGDFIIAGAIKDATTIIRIVDNGHVLE